MRVHPKLYYGTLHPKCLEVNAISVYSGIAEIRAHRSKCNVQTKGSEPHIESMDDGRGEHGSSCISIRQKKGDFLEDQPFSSMKFSSRMKLLINGLLNRVGLHLDTLTTYRRETARLQRLQKEGYFDRPVFPLPESLRISSSDLVCDDLLRYASRFDDFVEPTRNPVGFHFDNGFFTSPDAEVLYCMIRRHRPRKIVEIGSGSSTRISRLALMDGEIEGQLVSIDPEPRSDIDEFADHVYRDPVENSNDLSLFSELEENDVLFIDSSHEFCAGNDLTYLYLRVLPILAPGVVVHIHDIFLPYDYPADWLLTQRLHYTEQYVVQVLLQCEGAFEVLWPGYFLQRTMSDFSDKFRHRKLGNAQSLWLRKC